MITYFTSLILIQKKFMAIHGGASWFTNMLGRTRYSPQQAAVFFFVPKKKDPLRCLHNLSLYTSKWVR
jgi:hypothetical protein